MDEYLGVAGGDQDLDLTGAVALDGRGRIGLITGRRRETVTVGSRTGASTVEVSYWKGVVAAPWTEPEIAAPDPAWRWTAARPVVVASSLREYAEATDDLLGLEELRRRRDRA
jgi:hypothetical protein